MTKVFFILMMAMAKCSFAMESPENVNIISPKDKQTALWAAQCFLRDFEDEKTDVGTYLGDLGGTNWGMDLETFAKVKAGMPKIPKEYFPDLNHLIKERLENQKPDTKEYGCSYGRGLINWKKLLEGQTPTWENFDKKLHKVFADLKKKAENSGYEHFNSEILNWNKQEEATQKALEALKTKISDLKNANSKEPKKEENLLANQPPVAAWLSAEQIIMSYQKKEKLFLDSERQELKTAYEALIKKIDPFLAELYLVERDTKFLRKKVSFQMNDGIFYQYLNNLLDNPFGEDLNQRLQNLALQESGEYLALADKLAPKK